MVSTYNFGNKKQVVEGRSRFTQKSTANVLSLFQGLQVYIIKKFDYCQQFMHVIIDFKAAISKLRLLRQRWGRQCWTKFSYFS